MLARLAWGLLLGALLLFAWLFLGAEREPRVVRADAPVAAAPAAEDAALRELDAPRASSARAAPLPEAAPQVRREAAAEPDVRILASLEDPDVARAWGGAWRYELQTWDEERNTVELHSAEADADGRAAFAFVGPVHVDWVRVQPPASSGMALAFVEEHINLDPGDEHEVVLAPQPGGAVVGRVVDLQGRAVVGALVHAFHEDVAWSASEWQPGLVVVETDGAGRFRTPLLPPSQWGLCVEPGEWLSYAPPLGEAERGVNFVRATVGGDSEEARLVVTRSSALTLRVVDGQGEPVEGASVQLEPLQLMGGSMLLEAPAEADPLAVLLSGPEAKDGQEPWVWPYGTQYATTNGEGSARLVGVAGAWTLSIWGPFDPADRAPPALRQRIDLPGPDFTFTLDARFDAFRGRVRDERGAPQADVLVSLREAGTTDSLASVRTQSDGRFAFEWLRPGMAYEVRLRRTGWLTQVRPIAPTPAEAEPEEFVLREGLDVVLSLVTPDGEPLARATLEVQALRPDDPRPEEDEVVQSLARPTRRRADRSGRLRLRGVPPGELVLGLRRSVAVPGEDGLPMIDAFGRVRSEDRVVHSWSVRLPPAAQRLEVDVSAWPPPTQPELAGHVGRVLDAATGAPLSGAQVYVRAEEGFRTTRTDEEGVFALRGLYVPHDVFARADGYAAESRSLRAWAPTRHEHEFLLRAGSDVCELTLVDRNGERLPTVRVLARDAEGAERRLLTRRQDGGVRYGTQSTALDGRLTLLGEPPGPLDLELQLSPLGTLGHCRVVVAGSAAPQQLVGRLERSLDELREELRGLIGSEDVED